MYFENTDLMVLTNIFCGQVKFCGQVNYFGYQPGGPVGKKVSLHPWFKD